MNDILAQALGRMDDPEFGGTVADVAAACGLSPFQLARLFGAAMGMAPGAYMSRVRLERAAGRLCAEPATALTEIALDAGFESQQTFTRAFRRWAGTSPGRYRKEGKMSIAARVTEPEEKILLRADKALSAMGPMRVAGFSVLVDGSGKHNPPDAWAKLGPHLPVRGQDAGYAVGVCWSEGDDGTFTYMAGVVLRDGVTAPAGLEVRDIPAQRYVIFRQYIKPGAFMPQVRAGIKALWNVRLPRMKIKPSGGPDFEVYPDELVAGETAGWLEYRIPVGTTA